MINRRQGGFLTAWSGCHMASASFPQVHPAARASASAGAAHGNQEAMDAFARVIAGVTSPAEYFSEESVGWILATR
jgi:hypothetical protein